MFQTSDNNKRIAKNTLLPYALYDDGMAVYVPCHTGCVGSGGLWNTFLSTVNTSLSSLLCASLTKYI